MDDPGEDIVNKLDQLLNNVASGLEKLFDASKEKKEKYHTYLNPTKIKNNIN